MERSLKKLEKQIGNATSAILSGLNSPALLGEFRKADLIERLARVDLPDPNLPENLDRLYAERVRDLEAIIADPKLVQQAIDVMKLLVERIVVEERPGGGHVLDLQGNLARMLVASAPDQGWSSAAFSKSSLKLVAGVGFEPTTFRL